MGKDSLAMVLKLLELNYPLDEVVWFNMKGAEFSCMEKNAEKLRKLLESKGIQFTVLEPEHDFKYYMLERAVTKRDGTIQQGYKWCGGKCRWGTALKLDAIYKHEKETSFEYPVVVEYVGIAYDEKHRINRDRQSERVKLYPLVEWGMLEKDCLVYCYDNGWDFIEDGVELYSCLDRVSCKYCKNKNLSELRAIYNNFPSIWSELVELQDKIDIPFRSSGETIYDLEERFFYENAQLTLF